jgi:hypothetical protein
MQNFDPFLDWNAIDDEIAAELNKALKNYRRAMEAFAKMKRGDEDFARAAQVFLKTQLRLQRMASGVINHIYTVPVMVHVAGEKKVETNPDNEDQTGVLQRCARCGSILNLWREGMMMLDPEEGPREVCEEDLPWFEPGTVIAKAENNGSISLYPIEGDRELEKHERECVALNELFGT